MSAESDARETPRPEAGSAGRLSGTLRIVVEGEARRVLADAQIAAAPERLAEGWERRFIAEGARVDEMVRLYRDLGFETAVDPIHPADVGEDCGDCRLVAQLGFKMIYTRASRGT